MRRRLPCFIVLFILGVIVDSKTTAKEIIKLGTLATEGSQWGDILHQMKIELEEKSDGALRLRILPPMDERALVDLIEQRRLDAISVSAPGLGQILTDVFLFQLPLLFSNYEEVDYVRNRLTPYFAQQFEKEGYVLLGWGDLGFAYLFSKEPIRSQTDLQRTALWVWDIDPVAKAFASKSGREPVLLPIQSVLSSLEQGDIETVYAPPLACVVYQWHTKVRYMTDLPLVAGVGATIISKRRWDRFPEEHKRLLREIGRKYHEQLIPGIRTSNEETKRILKEKWEIERISVSHQEEQKWRRLAEQLQHDLVGLYTKQLLEEVQELLEVYRRNR